MQNLKSTVMSGLLKFLVFAEIKQKKKFTKIQKLNRSCSKIKRKGKKRVRKKSKEFLTAH